MKFAIFFIAIVFVSLPSMAKPTRPVYHVFLVHGLGATPDTFGSLELVLEKEMNQLRSDYQFKVHALSYDTGNHSRYAKHFAETVNKKIREIGIQSTDKLGFIGHSQGGVILSTWYLNTFTSGSPSDQKLISQVDAVITAGTPFWGSKLAYVGYQAFNPEAPIDQVQPMLNHIKDFLPYYAKWIPGLLGKTFSVLPDSNLNQNVFTTIANWFDLGVKELTELAILSESTVDIREHAIAADKLIKLGAIDRARILNISGVLPREGSKKFDKFGGIFNDKIDDALELLPTKGFGGNRFESDLAVSVPSSRFDFIYGEAGFAETEAEANETFRDFKYTGSQSEPGVPFHITETFHSGIGTLPNLVKVPIDCHPTIRKKKEQINDILEGRWNHPTKKKALVNGIIGDPEISKRFWQEKFKRGLVSPRKLKPIEICQHGVYKYFLQHLSNCSTKFGLACENENINKEQYSKTITMLDTNNRGAGSFPSDESLKMQMQGFTLEVNIDLKSTKLNAEQLQPIIRESLKIHPSNIISPRTLRYLKFDFESAQLNPDVPDHLLTFEQEKGGLLVGVSGYEVRIGKPKEILSVAGTYTVADLDGKAQNRMRFFITGTIKSKIRDNMPINDRDYPIHFSVDIPGFQPRNVSAIVRPSYSTYLDIGLLPLGEIQR